MRTWLTSRLLAAHVVGLVAVGAAVWLGFWQLSVWQAERDDEAVDLTAAEPVPLADVIGPDDGFPGDRVGQPVTLSGTWVPEGTVLVDGRPHDGDRGLWVVTPLEVSPGSALPVVRGWVASEDDVPPAPEGEAELVGWLQPPDGSGAVDDDATDDVFPELRIADLVQRVDDDLYAAYAIAIDGVDGLPAGELAELPEVNAFTGLQNFLYGLQWWAFAVFFGVVWWRFVQDEAAHAAAAEAEATDSVRA